LRIQRVKGSGIATTIAVELPSPVGSWHAKLRPPRDTSLLRRELANTRWASQYVPTPSAATLARLPGVTALITKTIPGVPGHRLINYLPAATVVAAHTRALDAVQHIPAAQTPLCLRDDSPPPTFTEEYIRMRLHSLHPDHAKSTPSELFELLRAGSGEPFVKRVVLHGDLCPPNLIFSPTGELRGMIDLGQMQVGPPNFDIAVLSWIIEALLGPLWSTLLLNARDLDRSARSIRFHRLMYDLSLMGHKPWSWIDDPVLVSRRERLANEHPTSEAN
jgi:aminoglycoside phosphotransferase